MRYFSMFTGVGGFELGIGDKGECVGFSEIDKYASQLLAKRFPEIRNFGDARKINPTELPEFDIPIECERLQGFPDNWTEGFSDTQRYKMMGNAVTVNVIKSVARRLLNDDNGNALETHT